MARSTLEFPVHMQLISGRTITCQATPDSKVQDLLDFASEALNYVTAMLSLSFKGSVLEPNLGFSAISVEPGDELDLFLSSQGDAVWSTACAFLALLQNGQFLAWGDSGLGGDITRNGVKEQLEQGKVQSVWSAAGAFLALLQNGQFLTWGDSDLGGDITRSGVKEQLEQGKVQSVWSTALLQNGQFLAWGYSDHGGDITRNGVKKDMGMTGIAIKPHVEGMFVIPHEFKRVGHEVNLNEFMLARHLGTQIAIPDGYVEGFGWILHEATGIEIHCPPLLIGPDAEDSFILYHYTIESSFNLITKTRDLRHLKASYRERAHFGDGCYASCKAPHEFVSKDDVLRNNYTNQEDPAEQERQIQTWREKGAADYCIPILVPKPCAIDVTKATTPEMKKAGTTREGHPIRPGRDIWVITIRDYADDEAHDAYEHTEAIYTNLRNADWSVREDAVLRLRVPAVAGHERAISAATACLYDPDPVVRIAAVDVMAACADGKDLLAGFLTSEQHVSVREVIAMALASIATS